MRDLRQARGSRMQTRVLQALRLRVHQKTHRESTELLYVRHTLEIAYRARVPAGETADKRKSRSLPARSYSLAQTIPQPSRTRQRESPNPPIKRSDLPDATFARRSRLPRPAARVPIILKMGKQRNE